MAPIRPSSSAKPTTNHLATKTRTSYPARASDSAFSATKRDKRLMKHSIFMSKVQDSSVRKPKRRRPGKKLVTTLESLEDAIQDVAQHGPQQASQTKNVREGRGQAKRREKVVKNERERFGKNIAVLSTAAQNDAVSAATTGSRFAALRAHIEATTATTTPSAG